MGDISDEVGKVLECVRPLAADPESSVSILATALACEAAFARLPIDQVIERVRDDHKAVVSIDDTLPI